MGHLAHREVLAWECEVCGARQLQVPQDPDSPLRIQRSGKFFLLLRVRVWCSIFDFFFSFCTRSTVVGKSSYFWSHIDSFFFAECPLFSRLYTGCGVCGVVRSRRIHSLLPERPCRGVPSRGQGQGIIVYLSVLFSGAAVLRFLLLNDCSAFSDFGAIVVAWFMMFDTFRSLILRIFFIQCRWCRWWKATTRKCSDTHCSALAKSWSTTGSFCDRGKGDHL